MSFFKSGNGKTPLCAAGLSTSVSSLPGGVHVQADRTPALQQHVAPFGVALARGFQRHDAVGTKAAEVLPQFAPRGNQAGVVKKGHGEGPHAPARGAKADRIALFPNGEPKRIVRALAVHLPKALLVTVDIGDEIPVTVGVHRSGAMLAFVQLDDHASTKEVEAAVTKLAAAMAVPVPLVKRKANEPFRNVVYRLLDVGTVVADNHFTGLTQRVAESPTDFVGFAYVHDTTIRELTDDMDLADDDDADDEDDEEEDAKPAPSKARAAAVEAPPKRTPRATEKNPVVAPAKSGKPGVTRIAPAEAAELSATFKHARTEPGRAEVVAGAEKQLAKASNASEWLAIRRTIDPARVAADVMNPVGTAFLNSSCDKASFGWPCDEKMEQLRDAFARETDAAKQKAIAEQVQLRYIEIPTHVHLGQWYKPIAMRKNIDGMITAPVVVFWNIEKK